MSRKRSRSNETDSDVEEIEPCGVCLEYRNTMLMRRPFRCTHDICISCIGDMGRTGAQLVCPFCRQPSILARNHWSWGPMPPLPSPPPIPPTRIPHAVVNRGRMPSAVADRLRQRFNGIVVDMMGLLTNRGDAPTLLDVIEYRNLSDYLISTLDTWYDECRMVAPADGRQQMMTACAATVSDFTTNMIAWLTTASDTGGSNRRLRAIVSLLANCLARWENLRGMLG